MLKKRIMALVMSSVLICISPMISYCMEKEDFLKFLVNSSYPEAQIEKNEEQEKEDINTNGENNDKEYVKFYVGEENIPPIKDNENTQKEDKSTQTTNLEYVDNIRVTSDKPRILIYHSHAGETYSNAPDGNYHSQDKENSIIKIGEMLTEELTQKGWGVVHSTKYHDYPLFNEAYATSRKTLDALLPKYPSIDIAIDLHRDGRTLTEKEAAKLGTTLDSLKAKEHNRVTTMYNGESVSKFLFVVGMKNENVGQIQSLSQDITSFAKNKYPELVLPVVKKPAGRFNQSVAKNHMLIEVGSNGSSIDESKASVKYIADILDGYFKTK